MKRRESRRAPWSVWRPNFRVAIVVVFVAIFWLGVGPCSRVCAAFTTSLSVGSASGTIDHDNNPTTPNIPLVDLVTGTGLGVSAGYVTSSVTSDNPSGYQMDMKAGGGNLVCGVNSGYTIPSRGGSPEEAALGGTEWGWNWENQVSPTRPSVWRAIPTGTAFNFPKVNTPSGSLHDGSAADSLRIWLGTQITDYTTPNCTYSQILTISVTANALPAPTVTSVSPVEGLSGKIITLTGTSMNLLKEVYIGAASATSGGVLCTSLSIISNTSATCVIPAGVSFGVQKIRIVSIYDEPFQIGPTFEYGDYEQELLAVQLLAQAIFQSGDPTFGAQLTEQTAVTIRGMNYWGDWYRVTAADLLAVDPTANTNNAPYIVRFNQYGHVMSIPGRIINGEPIHTFNYFGDGLVLRGLLTGVTGDSTTTNCQWGELTVGTGANTTGCGGTYDADGGLKLGTQHAMVNIDQTKPVGEQYSIGFTVRGIYPQAMISEGYPSTIVAISGASSNYLSWIGLRGQYLHIYSFFQGGAKANINTDTTMAGFTSIDITTFIPANAINNEFLNIQVTASRTGNTDVYLNGVLIRTFPSGGASLAYSYITIGDLRPNRLLRYVGSVYNFALYSEVLTFPEVTQNYTFMMADAGV